MTGARPLIAIDIGNTAIKLGRFLLPATSMRGTSETLPEPESTLRVKPGELDWGQIAAWIGEWIVLGNDAEIKIASVNRPTSERLASWISQTLPEVRFRFLTRRDFALPLDVEAPDRVGMDRVAGAWAAAKLKSPDRPAIVVDAGSAITIDLVSADGVFRGGAILPGWQTMARALAEKTDQLPLVALHVTNDRIPPVLGRSTEAAIASGLFWGSLGAVREIVDRLGSQHDPAPELILAGGDLSSLASHFTTARLEADLVLKGIASS